MSTDGQPSTDAATAFNSPAAFGVESPSPEEAARASHARNDDRFRQGETIVAASLTRGTWTESDIERFRALQRESPGPEWVWLMQRIDAAINDGKVKPDPRLPAWH